MTKQSDQDEPANRQTSRLSWLTSRGSSAESASSSESSSPSSSSSTTVVSNWDNAPQSDSTRNLPEKHLTKVEGKFDPSEFQTSALKEPPNNPDTPSIKDAVKTIKAEDFLNVGKVPCARQGYIYGIITGGIVGGIRFMMKGSSLMVPFFSPLPTYIPHLSLSSSEERRMWSFSVTKRRRESEASGIAYAFFSHHSAPVPKVANWAVGSTIAGAAASFEWCQYKRRQERVRMRRAVEVFQDSIKEKQKEAEAKKAEEEAARKEAEAANKKQRSWYTIW